MLRRLDAPRFSSPFTQRKEKIVHFFSPQLLLEEKLVLSEKLRMAGRRQHKDNWKWWTQKPSILKAAAS